jgi:hypothetical protein
MTRTDITQNTSNNSAEQKSTTQRTANQWAEVIAQLVDNLTGKNMSITYNFENLTIDVPKAQGPGGQDLGSARWTINGRIVIDAEANQGKSR